MGNLLLRAECSLLGWTFAFWIGWSHGWNGSILLLRWVRLVFFEGRTAHQHRAAAILHQRVEDHDTSGLGYQANYSGEMVWRKIGPRQWTFRFITIEATPKIWKGRYKLT